MNRVTSLVAAILITIPLSLTGFVAMAMPTGGDHSAMMQHGSADCMSSCLSKVPTNNVLPVIQQTIQLLASSGTQVAVLVLPALLALIFALYAARPRPSPNLIALHSNYLE